MSLASRKLIQSTAGAAGAADTGDDDFANVVLLLDGDGTSGDDNNTFTDSSTNGFTVTENGSVVQGSFSPYGDNWSNYFSDGSAYLTASPAAPGTGEFCYECWINVLQASDDAVLETRDTNNSANGFTLTVLNSSTIRVYSNSAKITASGLSYLNQWTHLCVEKVGSTTTLYINGVSYGTTTDLANMSNTNFRIGESQHYGAFSGYIANFRYVRGGYVYNGNFTPPTSPLTAVANTELLTCSSNRFVDESTNNHTVTVNGDIEVTPFSPFKDDDARDITTDGGSAYFGGSDDYLISSTNFTAIGTDDFTVEFWYNGGAQPDRYPCIIGTLDAFSATGAWRVQTYDNNTNRFQFTSAITNYVFTTTNYNDNAWHHFAVTREGTSLRGFVDGVQQGSTQTMSDSFTSRKILMMSQLRDGGDQVGYVSDARVIKGTALYTSSFTPPTAPLNATAVEGSAYSLSNASYEFKSVSVTSQATTPTGVQFNSDGTKMYVIDFDNDDIFQYSLSTAFDVSTASYDSVSFDGSSQETKPQGLVFSPDGTKMYTVGQTADSFFQYSLSTAFDLSTVSYASKSFSVASQDLTPTDLAISPDGTKMYMIGVTSDSIFEYDLSTAFDVSTASYNSVSLSLSAQDTSPRGLHFNSDGTKMFVAGDSSNSVLQYTLTTGFDLSTASYDSVSFSIGSEEGSPTALTFNADGTKFYILGSANDTVYQYSVSTVSALMLNFQDAGIYDLTGINNIDTVGDAQIDTAVKKYGTGSLEFDGSGDYLEAPYNKAYAFSGDFTVEFWIYYISHVGSYTGIICCANTHTGSGAPTAGWILSFYSTGDDLLWEIAGQGGFTSTSSLSKNQWVHLAVVRSGSTVTLYMDGVSVGSKTQSGTADSVSFPLFVGRGRSTVSTPYFEGYIDDIRITNGIARYTSSFTPPDAALPKF